MKGIFNRSADLFLSALFIFGGAVAGTLFLNYYSASPITGFFAGGIFGIIVLAFPKLVEMNFGGPGVKFQMKLNAAVQDAKQAKAIAKLIVETSIDIGSRPIGVFGGGRPWRNDLVVKNIADKLAEIGIDRKEASDYAKGSEPRFAFRILGAVLMNAVKSSPVGGKEKAEELRIPLLGENSQRDPDKIAELLGSDLMSDPEVASALAFYRQWHSSDEKLYFIVDNFKRLHKAEGARVD